MDPTLRLNDDRIRDFDFELDQLLIQLAMLEHPEWQKADGSCPSCWLEVQRRRAKEGVGQLRG